MGSKELPSSFIRFSAAHKDVVTAYDALNAVVREQGALSAREVALVKLALSVGAGMEGAVASHTRKALQAGADPDSLEQIALLALPTCGFPHMMKSWKRIVEQFD